MKRVSILIVLFFLTISWKAHAQDDFEIEKLPDSVDEQTYQAALKDANLDRYRYHTDRRKLYFKSGVVVEVLSAQEMNQQNLPFDSSKVMESKVPKKDQPEFRLDDSGYIMEVHQSIPQKK